MGRSPFFETGTGSSVILWKGNWNEGANYYDGDSVKYGNSCYICTLAHTNKYPTNTAFWDVLVAGPSLTSTSSIFMAST